MQKKKQLFLSISCLILFSFGSICAQPKQVIVKSLTISNLGGAANSYGRMEIQTDEFTDTAGVGEWGIPGLTQCLPCPLGITVSTSYIGGVRFGKFFPEPRRYLYYYFEDLTMSSRTIKLSYLRPRNRAVTHRMPAKIKGRLRVFEEAANGNQTPLYTADIDMEGSAVIKFSPISPFQKLSTFRSAVYTYLPVGSKTQ